MKKIIIAMQAQLSLVIGFGICLFVSYFYFFINDPRFPQERPELLWVGFLLSLAFFLIGNKLSKKYPNETKVDLKEGAQAVLLIWVLAIFTSALVFVLSGFPDPLHPENFSIFRKITDAIFESVSGYTTAGGSILPSVETFPRGILMWRSMTHWLGGVGMALLAVTIWRHFRFKRETIMNSEAEGPNYVHYDSEKEAITAGVYFLKTYGLITLILVILLIISGLLFRTAPYEQWYDVGFDSFNHALSVMGTGGFSTYDSSAGLPITELGKSVIGGLRSPVSEWIIATFMFIAGGNFSLWFLVLYKREWSEVIKNKELRIYTIFVLLITLGITVILMENNVYSSVADALRYAFFNVTTIISTTGLATSDFTQWPGAAEGLLFICYLVGGMVGSTAGGLKMLRFGILYKYVIMKIQNLIYGRHKTRFLFDGVLYDENAASLIVTNIVLYYMIFLGGAVLIMVASPIGTLIDGTKTTVDFTSAITSSIANLGNIGPMASIGNINAGPAGNYFAFSEVAKIIMSVLMMIGRIGVITVLTLFITNKGIASVKDSVEEQRFDSDEPLLHV